MSRTRKKSAKSVFDRFYKALDLVILARNKVERELAKELAKTCKTRFSLCLDCSLHNYCPRYIKHREEDRVNKLGAVQTANVKSSPRKGA